MVHAVSQAEVCKAPQKSLWVGVRMNDTTRAFADEDSMDTCDGGSGGQLKH